MTGQMLRRSTRNKMIGGLCGGVGEYFAIDPTLVRLIWVLVTLWLGGAAVLTYFLGLIIIPTDKQAFSEEEVKLKRPTFNLLWGWLLIGLGAFLLLENLGFLFEYKKFFLPALFIGLGGWILFKGLQRRSSD